jgi:hypothetical protein
MRHLQEVLPASAEPALPDRARRLPLPGAVLPSAFPICASRPPERLPLVWQAPAQLQEEMDPNRHTWHDASMRHRVVT